MEIQKSLLSLFFVNPSIIWGSTSQTANGSNRWTWLSVILHNHLLSLGVTSLTRGVERGPQFMRWPSLALKSCHSGESKRGDDEVFPWSSCWPAPALPGTSLFPLSITRALAQSLCLTVPQLPDRIHSSRCSRARFIRRCQFAQNLWKDLRTDRCLTSNDSPARRNTNQLGTHAVEMYHRPRCLPLGPAVWGPEAVNLLTDALEEADPPPPLLTIGYTPPPTTTTKGLLRHPAASKSVG